MPELTFHLPDLGEGLAEAEIVEWHVSVGQTVTSGQPLVAVETDKAVVDIPSPRTAQIAALHGQAGDRIDVGAPLVRFIVDKEDAGAIVGNLTGSQKTAQAIGTPTTAGKTPASGDRVRATPKARKRARALGLDLDRIPTTGTVLQVADVEAAAAGGEASQTLAGVRRSMAIRMTQAHARVVPASVTEEAEISSWGADQKPMPRLIRALARGCVAAPNLNALFDDATLSLTRRASVDLGIAMETEDGLFVPVLRDAGGHSPDELTAALADLERSVTNRSIAPDALRGQSITLSNFGSVAGLHAQMVVVPPQVAIVGAGRIFSRLVLSQGVPGTARILPLSLTFDHRAVTGAEACHFLAAMIEDLEAPA